MVLEARIAELNGAVASLKARLSDAGMQSRQLKQGEMALTSKVQAL
jgi:hypothetical protein